MGHYLKGQVNRVSYNLFQNGRHFSILFLTSKLSLVASFKGKYSFDFEFKNEATRANLEVNKIILKWWPFWNKVCCKPETFWLHKVCSKQQKRNNWEFESFALQTDTALWKNGDC